MNSSKNKDAEFAFGSGHINPVKAVNPGLVYETLEQDYIIMLCSMGYDESNIGKIYGNISNCPKAQIKQHQEISITLHWQLKFPQESLSQSTFQGLLLTLALQTPLTRQKSCKIRK